MGKSRVDNLRELRDLLWESLKDVPANQRAPLAKQYRDTMAEIAELSGAQKKQVAGKKVDPLDELAARRSARRSAAKNSGQAEERQG